MVTMGVSPVKPAGCDCRPENITPNNTAIAIEMALMVPRPPS